MRMHATDLFGNALVMKKIHISSWDITYLKATIFCFNNFFYEITYIKTLKSKTHESFIFDITIVKIHEKINKRFNSRN